MDVKKTYSGSCHCGKVRFRVTGRATSYRGLNHILIEDAAILSDGK